jgi:hypothetical protein
LFLLFRGFNGLTSFADQRGNFLNVHAGDLEMVLLGQFLEILVLGVRFGFGGCLVTLVVDGV